MYRSIFFNCWVALFAFAAYFFTTIYQTKGFAQPLPTLLWSFVWAIIGFIVAFVIRKVLDYVLYTPESIHLMDEEVDQIANNDVNQMNVNQEIPTSTVEFQDESSEEVAQVIRTMLNQEETIRD